MVKANFEGLQAGIEEIEARKRVGPDRELRLPERLQTEMGRPEGLEPSTVKPDRPLEFPGGMDRESFFDDQEAAYNYR
jgi:hypothetical protein